MTTRIRVFDLILFIILGSVVLGIGYDLINKLNNRWSPVIEEREEERIDWHDWDLIKQDELRTGIGEHGEPAHLDSYPAYSKEINETVGYNGYLSDKIALDRSLKDLRPPE